jgi:hypothetical protein
VREALKMLEAEGYVTRDSYRGAQVVPFDAAASGEIAYAVGRAKVSFRRKGLTEIEESPGHYLSVWRRGESGEWKLWASGTLVACRFIKLFETVALEAGPELTNDSFAAAAAGLTQFSIPGQPFASLGEKGDSNDSFALVSFNPDIGAEGGFDEITEVQDVTP